MSKNANQAVLDYLLAQNRPYSTNDIVMNLHKEHGKAAVQKALDLLVADAKITEKVNGKQKAYVIRQDDLPTASETELAELDAGVNAGQEALKTALEAVRAAEVAQRALQAAPTTAEAAAQAGRMAEEVAGLEGRLQRLQGQTAAELVSKEDKEKMLVNHEGAVKEWRRRKRMCTNIIDAILETYPKPKKALFEEVGIETDEEHGARMPDM